MTIPGAPHFHDAICAARCRHPEQRHHACRQRFLYEILPGHKVNIQSLCQRLARHIEDHHLSRRESLPALVVMNGVEVPELTVPKGHESRRNVSIASLITPYSTIAYFSYIRCVA